MANRHPAIPTQQSARVIHYVDSTPAELTYPMHPALLAIRREQQKALYARWKQRQEVIAERDRKLRRFWLGFGAIIAVALLLGLGLAGWFLWQAIAALSLGVLAIPAVLLLIALLGFGGHKCVTVVQHWH